MNKYIYIVLLFLLIVVLFSCQFNANNPSTPSEPGTTPSDSKVSITPSVSKVSVMSYDYIEVQFKKTPSDAKGTFKVSPGLPGKLNFDPSTGRIYGRANELASRETYTVSFSGNKGNAEASVDIELYDDRHFIKEFKFKGISTTANIRNFTGGANDGIDRGYIEIKVPFGTDISRLTAVFSASPGATVSVNEVPQISGITVNDFIAPKPFSTYETDLISYKVTSKNSKYKFLYRVMVFETVTRSQLINKISAEDDLRYLDTSQVTDMSDLFKNNKTIVDQTISLWDTSNVTDMSYMFNNANFGRKSISYWDVSKVRNMTSMFEGATFFGDLSSWGDKVSRDIPHANFAKDSSPIFTSRFRPHPNW